MKQIVLLGDSIRIGYGKTVAEKLKDEYEVWQPADNCRFTTYTYRMLFEYRNEIENANIIHWNNGHWDMTHCMGDGPFTPLEDYIENIKRIAQRLLKITDKVIFATTTAVSDNALYDKNETIKQYNEAVIPVLCDMGVYINDLHSVVAPNIDEYICSDHLHLSHLGIVACAEKVIDKIREVDKI